MSDHEHGPIDIPSRVTGLNRDKPDLDPWVGVASVPACEESEVHGAHLIPGTDMMCFGVFPGEVPEEPRIGDWVQVWGRVLTVCPDDYLIEMVSYHGTYETDVRKDRAVKCPAPPFAQRCSAMTEAGPEALTYVRCLLPEGHSDHHVTKSVEWGYERTSGYFGEI